MNLKFISIQLLLALSFINYSPIVVSEEIEFRDAASAFETLYQTRPAFEVIKLADESLINPITTAFTKAQAAYWGGRASEDIGFSSRAEEFYQISIDYSPRWWQPVKSLFRLYIKNGKTKEAKVFIQALDRRNTPEYIINSLRVELSRNTGEALTNYEYDFGLIYDSNINQGFSADTVSYFGLPFKANPESKPKSALGYQFNLRYYATWFISKERALGFSVNADSADFKSSIGDNSSARFQLSLNHLEDRASRINFGRKWYQGEELFDFVAMDFFINKKIKPELSFFIAPQIGTYKYDVLDNHSGDFIATSIGSQFFNKTVSSAYLKISKYKANDPVYSFNEIGVGIQLAYPKKLFERVRISASNKNYELIMIEFGKKREDKIYNIAFDLKDLSFFDRSIKLRLTYEKNDSNIDIYKRDGWSIEWNRNI